MLSRRGFLGAAATGTALAAVPELPVRAVAAQSAAPRPTHVPVTVPDDPALHAIRRLGYGPTPSDLAAIRKSGVAGWLKSQLSSQDDAQEELINLAFPFQSLSAQNMVGAYGGDAYTATQAYEWATLFRTMFSEQQVRARLAEVWLDHFNVCALVEKSTLPWTRFS